MKKTSPAQTPTSKKAVDTAIMAEPREISGYDRTRLRAQLRAADVVLGLVINFAGRRLKDGLVRVLNPDKLNAQRDEHADESADEHADEHAEEHVEVVRVDGRHVGVMRLVRGGVSGRGAGGGLRRRSAARCAEDEDCEGGQMISHASGTPAA